MHKPYCSIPDETKGSQYIRAPGGAYLLSGLRFSTAVCVWLVVSTDINLPFGPVVVDTTSYSEKRENSRSAFNQNISTLPIHEIIQKTVTYFNKRHMTLEAEHVFCCCDVTVHEDL